MPWEERNAVSLRYEFVMLTRNGEMSLSQACIRFGISRKTGYKWLRRYANNGAAGLSDRSRRPHRITLKVPAELEDQIIDWRKKHPTWGARKIRKKLQDSGYSPLPACSTITVVLHRNGLIDKAVSSHKKWQRFEHASPNNLWQMDFKGPVSTLEGICHPLTILDDCSRFSLCLKALSDQTRASVEKTLSEVLLRYGLPDRILMDNGAPWRKDETHPYSKLGTWLIRLGVRVSHSSSYHPQTLGKDERFHRTLKNDLINRQQWQNQYHLQEGFDIFRDEYNFERPHDSLLLDVPASRYQPSLRSFPSSLPAIEYDSNMMVRKVQQKGEIFFKGRIFRVSRAFAGYPVGIEATEFDGLFDVWFCKEPIAQIDMRKTE